MADNRQPTGLDDDLKDRTDSGIEPKTVDWFELTFRQALTNGLKPDMNHLVTVSFPLVGGVQICRVDVKPAPEPIFLVMKNVTEFYVRHGNCHDRWKSSPLSITSGSTGPARPARSDLFSSPSYRTTADRTRVIH